MGDAMLNVLSDILKVEGIEEAFSCFLVHRANAERDKIAAWQQELQNALCGINQDQVETAVRQYLSVAATCSYSRLQLLMELLEALVKGGTLPARLVCETIIICDKLNYGNQNFWVECFKLLRRIIDMVEYKGVREIMKVSKIWVIMQISDASPILQLVVSNDKFTHKK